MSISTKRPDTSFTLFLGTPSATLAALTFIAISVGLLFQTFPVYGDASLGSWTKFSDNPLNILGEKSSQASVLYSNGTYWAYYVRGDLAIRGIHLAKSQDGISWNYLGQVLGSGGQGSWDATGLGGAAVVKVGERFFMYYNAGSQGSIGVATSSDGQNFVKYLGNPIVTTGGNGGWDDFRITGQPTILHDADRFWVYYPAQQVAGGATRIGLARSTDGFSFTKHTSNPILTPTPESWVYSDIFPHSVIKDGPIYRLWYFTVSSGGPNRIGQATSTDGFAWSKDLSNPAIDVSTTGWDSAHVSYPSIVKVGNSYRIYYTGSSGETSFTGLAYINATPSAPINLQALAGDGEVNLTWLEPSSDGGSPITGYRIYRSTVAGQESILVSLDKTLSHTDKSVSNAVRYFYKVTAVNAVGESPRSDEVSTFPKGPLKVQISATPSNGRRPLLVQFSSAPSGGVLPYSYLWNFGDRRNSTQPNPAYTYELTGSYVVRVSVTDSEGSATEASISIIVEKALFNIILDTSPRISSIKVDGVVYSIGNLSISLSFEEGSTHTFSVSDAVIPRDLRTRYLFKGWSDGANSPSRTVTFSGNTSLIAEFKTQHYVTVVGDGATGEGWYDEGHAASIRAPFVLDVDASSRTSLFKWQLDGADKPTARKGFGTFSADLNIEAPHTVNLVRIKQYHLAVEGAPVASYLNSQTDDGWYDQGSSTAQVQAAHIVSGVREGVRQSLRSWRLDVNAVEGVIRAEAGVFTTRLIKMDEPHVARFEYMPQYLLKVVSEYGATLGVGWYDGGSEATFGIRESPVSGGLGTRHIFVGWRSSDLSGYAGPRLQSTVVMNGPTTQTGDWKTQYSLELKTPIGEKNEPIGAPRQSAPDGWYFSGDTAQITIATPWISSEGIRYQFVRYSGTQGIDELTGTLVMNEAKTITLDWRKKVLLSITTVPDGLLRENQRWVDFQTVFNLADLSSVRGDNASDYVLVAYTVDGALGDTRNLRLTVDKPHELLLVYWLKTTLNLPLGERIYEVTVRTNSTILRTESLPRSLGISVELSPSGGVGALEVDIPNSLLKDANSHQSKILAIVGGQMASSHVIAEGELTKAALAYSGSEKNVSVYFNSHTLTIRTLSQILGISIPYTQLRIDSADGKVSLTATSSSEGKVELGLPANTYGIKGEFLGAASQKRLTLGSDAEEELRFWLYWDSLSIILISTLGVLSLNLYLRKR